MTEESQKDISTDGEVQTNQQFQAISQQQLRREVRNLIDTAARSGIPQDDIEEILQDLSTGTKYYYEDIIRYSQRSPEEE